MKGKPELICAFGAMATFHDHFDIEDGRCTECKLPFVKARDGCDVAQLARTGLAQRAKK
jgi:hypothetical protein